MTEELETQVMEEIEVIAFAPMLRENIVPMYLAYRDAQGNMAPKDWWQAWVEMKDREHPPDVRPHPAALERMGTLLEYYVAKADRNAFWQSLIVNR